MKRNLFILSAFALGILVESLSADPPASRRVPDRPIKKPVVKPPVRPVPVRPAPRPAIKPVPIPAVRPAVIRPVRPLVLGRPAPQPPRPTPVPTIQGEKVQLLNGDVLRGKFIGYDPAKGVIWRHPHITPDMAIKPDRVARVTFANATLPAAAKTHPCTVRLANGDFLSGDLVKLSDDKLVLKTWYGGELTISRSVIQTLSPGYIAAKTLFEGPTSAKNWTFVNPVNGINIGQLPPNAAPQVVEAWQKRMAAINGKWELKNEGFETRTSGAMVGRNFKNLPDRSSIEFELEWTSYLNLYVNLYTDKLNSYSSCNAYSLRINQSYAYLYRYTRLRGSQRIGGNVSIKLPTGANRKHRAKFVLKVDKKKREFSLYIDGKYKTKWKDAVGGDFAGKGPGLLFTTRSANPLRISGIRLNEWNGALPGQNKSSVGNGKQDFVLFNNDDSITGKLINIENGSMKFKTTFAELPVPLQNVNTIHLSRQSVRIPTVPADSARVALKGKGTLTLRIQQWKEGKIQATSPIFGKATLDASALRSVEFNLGKTRQTSSVLTTGQSPYTRVRGAKNVPIEIFGGGALAPEAIQELEFQFNNKNVPPQIFEQLQEKLQEQRLQVRPLPKRR